MKLPLDKPVIVGRKSSSNLKIRDVTVSGHHAEIQKHEGRLWVRDLGSLNGTYVDGRALVEGEWGELSSESQISLGRNPKNLISLSGETKTERDPHQDGLTSTGQRLKLPAEGSEFVWGRSPDLDQPISQESSKVSRNHVAIRRNAGALWIKDLGSRNGTFIGQGEALEKGVWTEVKEGQTIDLGSQLKINVAPSLPPTPSFPATRPEPSISSDSHSEVIEGQGLTSLTPLESVDILSRAKVTPSMFRTYGTPDLTPEYLGKHGFGPAQTIKVGDKSIHVSKPYRMGRRHAMVGFVEGSDGQVSVRTFYRSSSHAMWKVASHSGIDGWFGKGKGQESVTLPLSAQKALAGVSADVETPTEQARQLFYGALEIGDSEHIGSFENEISVKALGVQGGGKKRHDPENARLSNPQDRPDYSQEPDVFFLRSNIQGKVKASVLPSQNGQQDFMFCQDEEGRTWLGGIFDRSEDVNSFGVKKQAVSAEVLTSPAIDYDGAHPQHQGEIAAGRYADFTAFTHKLPVVADFLSSQAQAKVS